MIVAELLHFVNNVLHTRSLNAQRLVYQDVTRAELQALTRFQWDAYRTISLDFVELYFQITKDAYDKHLDENKRKISDDWSFMVLEKVRERAISLNNTMVDAEWTSKWKPSELAFAALRISF